MDTKIDEQLLGEAARWSARLGAHDCSEAEHAAFESWCGAKIAHREAFTRVQAAAASIDRQVRADKRLQQLAEKAFAAGATIATADLVLVAKPVVTGNSINLVKNTDARPRQPMQKVALVAIAAPAPAPVLCANMQSNEISFQDRTQHRKLPPNSRAGIALAMAASVAMVAFVAWRMPAQSSQTKFSSALQTAELQAPAQAAQHVTLSDGTVVHLDAGAKVTVAISARERRIQLQAGRAYFEVAHDASRPFSVAANGTRTVALGTKFQVQRLGDETVVTLTQGSVAVSGKNGAWQERLQPGEQLKIAASAEHPERRVVDAGDVTSWSRGWLVFRRTPLTEALSEINRYSDKKLVIADATLSELSVAGSFIAGDAQSIVDAIAAVLPIRVVDGGQHEILLFRRYDN